VIEPTDRGFTLGDGLFETLLWQGGRLHEVAAHLDRMAAGCGVLGLPAPERSAAEAMMRDAVAAAGLAETRAAVRLTLSAGPGGRGLDRPEAIEPVLVATAAAAPRPTTPARLAVSGVRRNDGSPASRLKTLSYLDNVLARREALAAGADEALMLDTRGRLSCAGAANLFWMVDDRLFTPALDCGVLAGVVRGRTIAAARARGIAVEEVAAAPEILRRASGIFLTNSLIGLRPVDEIENFRVPQSRMLDDISSDLGIH